MIDKNLIVGMVKNDVAFTVVYDKVTEREKVLKTTTREPGYPGSFEKILSITRVVEIRVFWTH
jgi:hypothetical protein